MLPPPPVLKTTIIQLNKDLDSDDNNYEILTNEYKGEVDLETPVKEQISLPKKKKRRSSVNVDSEELAKRKYETKQLHSIIEKRRRIKINREFEALKYLIPACKNTSTSPIMKPNNNGNKIDGMYKLTILKSSVEYIMYLHHLILKQSDIINKLDKDYCFDDEFARIPLNVNQYRNIDKDFDFKNLDQNLDNVIDEQDEEYEEEGEGEIQLPSPDITPDMHPRKHSVPISPHTILLKSKSPTGFSLPGPAMNYPQKKYFKSKVPGGNSIVDDSSLSDHDASRTLLQLRKSSIDSLLN